MWLLKDYCSTSYVYTQVSTSVLALVKAHNI